MVLCDYVIDIAIEEAKKRLENDLYVLAGEISDEIIETAVEYEPQAAN